MGVRERILSKTHELFHKYGIRSVTMDEIATQAGMSKKTIYQSFANKDELVDAVFGEHIELNTNRCLADCQIAKDAIEQIFFTMDMLQEMLSELNPGTIYDLEKFHPSTFKKLNHFKDLFLYKMVHENIEWGIKDGLYRSEIHIDIVTRIRLETMFLPFNPELFPPGKYDLLKVELELLDLFLFGLATTKAHKLISRYKTERIKTTTNERL